MKTLLSVALIAAAASAGDYDESLDGDLSGNPNAPTPLVLTNGSNVISGTMVAPSDVRDYLTFTVPAGSSLTAINLNTYEDSVGGGGNTGFHALYADSVGFNPTMANGDDLYGGSHVFEFFVGTDVLPTLAGAFGAGNGFTAPLGPGTYTYLIQQTGPDFTVYELDFVLESPVAYDEAVDGDLSNSAGAPTPIDLEAGRNVVRGTMIAPSDVRDYFTFTVPAGGALESVFLTRYFDVPTGDEGNTGFGAINAGPTSFIPNMTTAGNFLGGAHIEGFLIGTDILEFFAFAPSAGPGFVPPLGPGTYSFNIQQTSDDFTGYELEFVVDGPYEDLGCALPALGTGNPSLIGTGDLLPGTLGSFELSNAAPSSLAILFVSLADNPTPFKGGLLKPVPILLQVSLTTNAAGDIDLPFLWPAGANPLTIYVQYAIADAAGPKGATLSNTLQVSAP